MQFCVEGERNLTTARNSRGASKRKANSTRLPPRKKLLRFRVAKNVKALEKQRVIEKSEWLKIAEINFYFAVSWDIWRWNFLLLLFERRLAQRNIKIHVQQLFFSCFSVLSTSLYRPARAFFRSFVIDPAKSFVKLLKLWVVLFSPLTQFFSPQSLRKFCDFALAIQVESRSSVSRYHSANNRKLIQNIFQSNNSIRLIYRQE